MERKDIMEGKFMDEYGVVWETRKHPFHGLVLWNDELGWGNWFGGQGLTPFKP